MSINSIFPSMEGFPEQTRDSQEKLHLIFMATTMANYLGSIELLLIKYNGFIQAYPETDLQNLINAIEHKASGIRHLLSITLQRLSKWEDMKHVITRGFNERNDRFANPTSCETMASDKRFGEGLDGIGNPQQNPDPFRN